MLQIKGKYNETLLMTDTPEESSLSQVYEVLSMPYSKDVLIRYMADMHAGAGCTIGYTQTMGNYVVPNFVGVDIGCGVYAYNLEKVDVDFNALDAFIRANIPCGFNVRGKEYWEFEEMNDVLFNGRLKEVCNTIKLETGRVGKSIGTLGGGNHFLELDKDPEGNVWLVIHSGSRNFGAKVCEFHQKKAKEFVTTVLIHGVPRGMEYLPLEHGGDEYLKDMEVAQLFAHENRQAMAAILIEDFFGLEKEDLQGIHSVHNYINFEDNILRKGAIQANEGQLCVIPFNMRDGVAVCVGKGSRKWNFSAPHGAGRTMSRSKAKEKLDLSEYEKQMSNVFSTCVNRSTLDEAPGAYKDMRQIIVEMNETVDVEFFMKPIYNFKA